MAKGVDANFYSSELSSKRGPRKQLLTPAQKAQKAAARKARKAANQRAYEARRRQDPVANLQRADQKRLIFAKRWGNCNKLIRATASGLDQLEQLISTALAAHTTFSQRAAEWERLYKMQQAMGSLMS